jgi:hypothetical protein
MTHALRHKRLKRPKGAGDFTLRRCDKSDESDQRPGWGTYVAYVAYVADRKGEK